MRKLSALVLSVVILLCLCACTTPAELQASESSLLDSLQETQYLLNQYANSVNAPEPEEPIDFCWNRQTGLWVVMPENPTAGSIIIADAVGSMCQAGGWTYEKKELSGSVSQRSILTDAMADGGIGAVVYMGIDEHIAGILRQAALDGIMVFSAEPEAPQPLAGTVTVSEAVLAQETAELIAEWVDTYKEKTDSTGKLSVAVSAQGDGTDGTQWVSLTEAALSRKAGLSLGSCAEVSEEDVFDSSYDWARDVLAEDETTRIFCCRMPQAAYGVCCYLEQYCADRLLDLADYCVVWVGQDNESNAYISAAAENPSCTAAKGCVLFGDNPWQTGSRIGSELLGIVYGDMLPADADDIWSLLDQNGVEPPEDFPGWQWGLNAVVCTDSYASFGNYAGTLFRHTDTPMAELLAEAE